jgi:hypothetical protein
MVHVLQLTAVKYFVGSILPFLRGGINSIFSFSFRVKGKGHPRSGQEGPQGE